MDAAIKKIQQTNKLEGSQLKSLLKQDIKNDKKIETAERKNRMTKKGKC